MPILSPARRCPSVEVVHHAPPDRLNEDAWLVMQAGPLEDRILLAAIDGATTRLTPPPLARYLESRPVRLTPAAFAARLVRDALARHSAEGLFTDLRTLLVEVNADLGRALIQIFGALTLEAMAFPDDQMAALCHDPRLIRLGLPAAAVTLVEIDLAAQEIRYAHAGDTSLLIVYQDGRIEIPTQAGGGAFDNATHRAALLLRENHPSLSFRELINRPEVRQRVIHNALYHNYVDEHGLPQPRQGVGVIDGLPELRYFVQSGRLPVDGVRFAVAMTDGLEWPASASEAFADDDSTARRQLERRRAFMGEHIAELGLPGYLSLLREAEAKDEDFESYPRYKLHDDATGVLLRFG